MDLVARITRFLTHLISETNGLSLEDTLALAEQSPQLDSDAELAHAIRDFHSLLGRFRVKAIPIETLLGHDVSRALAAFFRAFPIPFRDEHIHLTGSLAADFVYPRLAPLLENPLYQGQIAQV